MNQGPEQEEDPTTERGFQRINFEDTWTGNGKAVDPDDGSDPAPEPSCEICNDSLWVVEPTQGSALRTVVPCTCQRESRDLTAHLRTYAELGQLERMTFETLLPDGRSGAVDSDLFVNAVEGAKAFSSEPSGWFALEGPSGSGKTHLIAAIANELIKRGTPVKYISALDIPDLFSPTSLGRADMETVDPFVTIHGAPILIVDDLGAHQSRPSVEAKIDQLLTHRANRNAPTVIAMAKPLSDLPERIAVKLEDSDLTKIFSLSSEPEVVESVATIPQAMLKRMTFDTFDPDGAPSSNSTEQASLSLALDAASKFAVNPEQWLYLHGDTGVGKTHLAVAIANSLIGKGKAFDFWTVPDLLDHLRHAYSGSNEAHFYETFSSVRNAEILILDDFGSQNMTDWALEKIYQLVAYRHDRLLPTVITSQFILWEAADNSYWKQLQGKQQWESIRSRLNDSSVVTERLMAAPDYRDRGR